VEYVGFPHPKVELGVLVHETRYNRECQQKLDSRTQPRSPLKRFRQGLSGLGKVGQFLNVTDEIRSCRVFHILSQLLRAAFVPVSISHRRQLKTCPVKIEKWFPSRKALLYQIR